jgi:hypothetical protein
MSFWLTKEWQARAAREIAVAIDQANLQLMSTPRSNGDWTRQILNALARPSISLCSGEGRQPAYGVRCGEKRDGNRGEWLYDFSCWLEDSNGRGFLGLPIIAESEWGKWADIWDDFDKLTQARAGLKILIFQRCRETPPGWEWRSELLARAQTFAPAPDDGWLFSIWEKGQFHHWSNRWQ